MQSLGRSRCTDVDQLDELVEWSLHFRQIDKGPFTGLIDILATDNLVAMHVNFNRRIHQTGEPVAGMKSFALQCTDSAPLEDWCGAQVTANDIIDFNQSGGFDGVSRAGLNAIAVSISDSLLASKATDLGIDFNTCFPDDGTSVLRDDGSSGQRYATTQLMQAFAGFEPLTGQARDQLGSQLEDLLATLLLTRSSRQQPNVQQITPGARKRLCNQAVDYLSYRLQEAVTVADLCRACGVSIATLERAFRDCFGVSPKQYINYARLNAVHRELTLALDAKVTDIANRYDFWHMGQFARDYRAFTGMLPSETLASRFQ